MASIYDKAAIYDLIDNEDRYKICQNHWKAVFDNRPIQTCLDVSIGSGSVTLPLSELQVKLSGSDLSESMLENCRKKAAAKNIDIELQCCDFRAVASRFSQKFDCVASTGNSLPYVTNEDVCKTLEQMGYGDIEVMNFPVQQPYTDIDDVDWYCVIAKKI